MGSYVPPTPEQFKTRFPVFEDMENDRVQLFLDEAMTSVDTSWVEADYARAIMYLAAHLIATDNSDEGAEIEIGPSGQGQIASESFGGGLSVSYVNTAAVAGSLSASDKYGSTVYGRRYLALLRRNRRGPLVV
jgi:hypothetical protein